MRERFSSAALLLAQAQLRQLGRPLPGEKAQKSQKTQQQQQSGNVAGACAALLQLEKKARQAEDAAGTRAVAVTIAAICAGAEVPEISALEEGEGSDKLKAEGGDLSLLDAQLSLEHSVVAPCDWDLLAEMLELLCKRRGQLKTVVQSVIRAGMSVVTHGMPQQGGDGDDSNDGDDDGSAMQIDSSNTAAPGAEKAFFEQLAGDAQKLKLLEHLRELTAGKIFVEVERARLTKLRADTLEVEGKISEAADVLQSVQVETFGQMERREKTQFILDQMRLCLAKGDYIKTQILSRKISKRVIDAPALADLKIRYFLLLARFHAHDSNWLEVARAFLEMYHTLPQTREEREADAAAQRAKEGGDGDAEMKDASSNEHLPSTDGAAARAKKEDKKEKTAKELLEEETARDARKNLFFLQIAALLVALAPHDAEQNDVLVRIAAERRLSTAAACEVHRQVLKLLQTKEVVTWTGEGGFEAKYWAQDGPLRQQLRSLEFVTGVHADPVAHEDKLTKAMQDRITEHSARTVAHYYDRITLQRLASLLDISREQAEEVVSDLVVKGTVWARIDRPGGVVNFRAGRTLKPAAVLNEWNSEVSQLLKLVDTSTHLIARENIIHKLA